MFKCKVCKTVTVKEKYDICDYCFKEYESWSGLNKVDETVYQVGCDTDTFTKSDFSGDRGVTDHAKRLVSNAK